VLNLGIGGLNLRASLRRLKSIGLRHDPDLIVYGFTHNDIEGRAYRRSVEPVWGLRSPLHLVRWAAPRWRELRDTVYPDPSSYLYELDENYFRNPEAWADFLADLDQLASVVQEQGICGVVFLHTGLQYLHRFHAFQRHYDAVEEAAEERGLAVVASFNSFRGRDPSSLWIYPGDSHPNAEGHRILAEALNAGLLPLPARCGLSDDAMAVGKVEWLDPTRTLDGFTLITPVAGNEVYWVSMTGAVVKQVHTDHTMVHAEQLPSGTLLTLPNAPPFSLREVDGQGRTIWSYSSPLGLIHHDAIHSPRDTFFTLVHEVEGGALHEQIIEIDRDGQIVWTWDSLDHLEISERRPFATSHRVWNAVDWLHPNSLDLFPDGDLLVSLRNLNQLLRIDYPSGEILWSWGPGVLGHQHAAKLLEDGKILLFDNGIYRTTDRLCDQPCRSRALEIDPETGQIVWSFESTDLFSTGLGDADRLRNGNTLITFGWARPRAVILEVTPAGEVVWKFESLVKTQVDLLGEKPGARLYRAQRVERVP
jgi:lysophospholipase L1-like esterase